MEELQIIIFKVGDELYGIDVTKVQGIEMVKGYTKLPAAENYIKGIINLRGSIIPVYSIRRKFNMADNNNGELQLIIVRIGELQVAFEIDKIDVIENVTEKMMYEIPIIVRNEETQCYDVAVYVRKNIVIVLDTEKMLSDEERKSVNALVKK